ncbi:hypothetical protein [Chryseobacterium sp.]|jgi:hypothetical protein|uniref:hypothetical protein n=1 Tax=Chryseobacterium sp. TaxID=1871047 RepID=UPI00283FC613|nr:hypothetical protein [Chryseobacterium sp.]MDR3025940.1 hypothetical protein [Chryseobacterium sp.]
MSKRNKYLVFVLIIITCIIVNAQKNDTIFIKKDKFQKIFIDKNKNSDHYQLISDFTDFNTLKNSSNVKNQILNSKWVQIQSYKGEYFLYYPCDQINELKYVINGNQVQIKSSEIVTYNIISLKRRRQNINIKYQEPNSQKQILLTIIPIDQEKGIYKFITFDGNLQYEKKMLQSDKYKNYNLIVNECTENKTSELDFEH